ncbi:MAG: peptidase M48, partial [Fulvivirga sp.]|nr:peptidase M48 [Fulvivirga sp.]
MKKISFIQISFLILIFVSGIFSCDENNNFVIFSIQDDIALGEKVSQQIANDPQFKLLDRNEHADAYIYLDALVDEILNSGKVTYREEFAWEVTIIEDDSTLN